MIPSSITISEAFWSIASIAILVKIITDIES